MRPYNSILSPRGMHDNFPDWRNYREFGGGMVTDWGAHHLDIAQWGLGMDDSGPVEILPPAAGKKRGAKLVYANGVTVEHTNGFGVEFFGTEGVVQVNRGKFTFKRGDEMIASFTGRKGDAEGERNLPRGGSAEGGARLSEGREDEALREQQSHRAISCNACASAGSPSRTNRSAARTVICCHLMNLAYYHGQKFQWDPAKFDFAGGTGDAKWLTREYRSPWKV